MDIPADHRFIKFKRMKKYIGIEIGGTKLQVLLANENLEILKKSFISVGEKKDADNIQRKIEDFIHEFLAFDNVCSIGVGFGGPLDYKTGKIITSHQVKGWNGFNLRKWLENISGLKVQVENDANTAALGEACYGSGKKYDKVFYVTLGSGIGGGYIIDKEIYHGMNPGESEIGQMVYDKSGTTFESLCSGWAVDKKIRKCIIDNPESKLAEIIGDNVDAESKFLGSAVEAGDPFAISILNETAEDLAFGLSHVIHLFHPEIIILGGGLSLMGELLRKTVASYIPGFVMKAFHPGTELLLAGLGENSVAYGALILAQKITT